MIKYTNTSKINIYIYVLFFMSWSIFTQVEGFSSMNDSFKSALRILTRDFDFQSLDRADRAFTAFFFVLFACIVIFIFVVSMPNRITYYFSPTVYLLNNIIVYTHRRKYFIIFHFSPFIWIIKSNVNQLFMRFNAMS